MYLIDTDDYPALAWQITIEAGARPEYHFAMDDNGVLTCIAHCGRFDDLDRMRDAVCRNIESHPEGLRDIKATLC